MIVVPVKNLTQTHVKYKLKDEAQSI